MANLKNFSPKMRDFPFSFKAVTIIGIGSVIINLSHRVSVPPPRKLPFLDGRIFRFFYRRPVSFPTHQPAVCLPIHMCSENEKLTYTRLHVRVGRSIGLAV